LKRARCGSISSQFAAVAALAEARPDEPREQRCSYAPFDPDDVVSDGDEELTVVDPSPDAPSPSNPPHPTEVQKRKSSIWFFFDDMETGLCQCRVCSSEVAHGGRTTNLFKHLRNRHAGLLATIDGSTVRSQADASAVIDKWRCQYDRKKQTTLNCFVPEKKQRMVEIALTVWAVENGISWRAFTVPSWKRVLCLLGADVGLGDHMRKVIFPQLSAQMKQYLAEQFGSRCVVSATSDGWTRKTTDLSLVSFTISWIDRRTMELVTVPIAAKRVKSEAADAITELWNSVCAVLPDTVLIGAMSTDGGANFRCAARRFVGEDSRCGSPVLFNSEIFLINFSCHNCSRYHTGGAACAMR